MPTAVPTARSILGLLSRPRIGELARDFELVIAPTAGKEQHVEALASHLRFRDLLGRLGRDELRAGCRAHGLDDASRARPALIAALLQAHGATESAPPAALFTGRESTRFVPREGDIVLARHRQWLVTGVAPPVNAGDATCVSLVCIDDDNQGRPLDVLWELELGARVHQPESHGLGAVDHIDPPRHFGAYLHALKWNAVTATDAKLFQAPFRAGIKLFNFQLTPLKKALELPRANLFIADDVGLGKTIEAGLVLQELQLRQRVDFALIVCPASVALQWRDEMGKRFGLHFEIYNREFVGRRRQERGFGVNPWETHTRFIITYQTLRRPEYREPLLRKLGEHRAPKTLLILDEAHNAAPASASKYAIDSSITRVVRDVAPRFENRLFLSATPHNGHSNSFSALLEIMDPQRFTRGIDVDPVARATVMVRRLKADLRGLDGVLFPRRDVIRVDLVHEGDRWLARSRGQTERDLGEGEPVEIRLAAMLAEYTQLMKPRRGRGALVFINLQKRMLSSIEAFHRTLDLHAAAVGRGKFDAQFAQPTLDADDDEYGADDDSLLARVDAETTAASRAVQTPEGRARQLLEDMTRLAAQHRAGPDAKARALIDWVRQHQCAAVRVGGADRKAAKADRAWNHRRVIVFTEYGDTKKWLRHVLAAAIEGTDDADNRIVEFHGGMSDDQRAEVQEAFNGEPSRHPVRILLATDAAREGVNLQGHCADLFHYDIPWNPSRMEQRNGRIDRTLQPAREVRCHYFFYPQRPEDAVLDTLVAKIEVIQRELGSLGSVLMSRIEKAMEQGIGATTAGDLQAAEQLGGLADVTRRELESERPDSKRLKAEIDEAGRILDGSRRVMDFEPRLLHDAIDVGLELSGVTGKLTPAKNAKPDEHPWVLPALPDSWQSTLDSLRRPRKRDESFWDWRRVPPLPVVFDAPSTMTDDRVHLHLHHPLVQRVLSRFLAQGFSAHDLSRVTIVRNRSDSLVRVIAFGRLSLFGKGATRLHDQLISFAAPWLESRGEGHLKPFSDQADRRAIERLETLLAESPTLDGISDETRDRLLRAAPADFAALWSYITVEADDIALKAERMLTARARAEADALRALIESQRHAIERKLGERRQQQLPFDASEREAAQQYEQEGKAMERRLMESAKELETEPAQIHELYRVVLRRLEPVGLVYLWPGTRG